MSNQVYANNVTKFYDLPLLMEWLTLSDETVPSNDLTYLIPFNIINPATPEYPGIVEFNLLGTAFSILKSGMYSINVNVGYKSLTTVTPPTLPVPIESNINLYITLTRSPQFTDLVLANNKLNCPAQSSTTEFNVVNISAVTYLQVGDILRTHFINNDASGGTTHLLSPSTGLIISRIN